MRGFYCSHEHTKNTKTHETLLIKKAFVRLRVLPVFVARLVTLRRDRQLGRRQQTELHVDWAHMRAEDGQRACEDGAADDAADAADDQRVRRADAGREGAGDEAAERHG